jgi:hypothetical protein
MKSKILNLGLILSSLAGYIEWGADKSLFLFQAEWEVFSKLIADPLSVIHPLTLLPLVGQIVLLYTLFQKIPRKLPTFIGLFCLAILLVFLTIVGIVSHNIKIFLSSIPFIIIAILTIRHYQKKGLQ